MRYYEMDIICNFAIVIITEKKMSNESIRGLLNTCSYSETLILVYLMLYNNTERPKDLCNN